MSDVRALWFITLYLFLLVSLESNQMETEDSGVKMEMEDTTSALRDVKIDEPGKPVSYIVSLWKLGERFLFNEMLLTTRCYFSTRWKCWQTSTWSNAA